MTALRWRLVVRSFLIQASWNYRNLLGTGLAWALRSPRPAATTGPDGELEDASVGLPAEEPDPGTPDDADTHWNFNSHPYLAGVALGALHTMEARGATPEELRRFRTALRAPLGALGDALVWVGWLPLSLLLGGIAFLLGASPLVAVGLVLVLHNGLHLWLRWWGVGVGLREGRAVGPALQRANLGKTGSRVRTVGIMVAGIFVGVLGVMSVGVLERPGPFLVGGGVLLTIGVLRGMSLPGPLPGLLALLLLGIGGLLAL